MTLFDRGGDEVTYGAPATPGGAYVSPGGEAATLRKVAGRFERRTPSGVVWTFDARNRLTEIRNGLFGSRFFDYDAAGALLRIRYVNVAGGTYRTDRFSANVGITARTDHLGRVLLSGFGVTDQVYDGSYAKIVAAGSPNDDVLDFSGVVGIDVELRGLAGNDVLRGGSGNDLLVGGAGDDLRQVAVADPTRAEESAVLFSIIYSVDVPEGVDLDAYTPPQVEELWDETEGDEQYEYSYLEGSWENGSHRKWAALLNRGQFDDFVERCGLYAESTETMGSLGAPGFGFGWAPALSFTSDDPDAILSAYVTPVPETSRPRCEERDWERVREAVLAVYG